MQYRVTEAEWFENVHCPACGGADFIDRGWIPRNEHFFAGAYISPRRPIRFRECRECGLVYKTHIPSKSSVATLTDNAQDDLWGWSGDYRKEIALIRKLLPQAFDILDVGPAGGNFLNAIRPYAGRVSGLDIVRFRNLRLSEDGEFIAGALEDDALAWSNRPYDVVTAFDVFEHFFEPGKALRNLAKLVRPGGYLVVGTGNRDAVERVDRWDYMSAPVHMICWSKRALECNAASVGFDLIDFATVQNRYAPASYSLASYLRYYAYLAAPALYHCLQKIAGKVGSIPGKPHLRDHLLAVFQRN